MNLKWPTQYNVVIVVDHGLGTILSAAAAAKSLQLCPTLCDPIDSSPPGFPSLGFSRQEHWSGLPFRSPMHESEKWKGSRSVVSDSSDPMDCSLPGSSIYEIFQAEVLEWGAIALASSGIRLRRNNSLVRYPALTWTTQTMPLNAGRKKNKGK